MHAVLKHKDLYADGLEQIRSLAADHEQTLRQRQQAGDELGGRRVQRLGDQAIARAADGVFTRICCASGFDALSNGATNCRRRSASLSDDNLIVRR